MAHQRKYRFFEDAGHGWLEVPRVEVEASGAAISLYSYYHPTTDMAYLEEDCDMWNFLGAMGKDGAAIGATVNSAMPRYLPAYSDRAMA
jgi:hypothetical protein